MPESFAKMHFELGDTYMELGLPQDAVREWQISSEHPAFRALSHRRIQALRFRPHLRLPSPKRQLAAWSDDTSCDDVDRAFDQMFGLV